MLLYLVAMAFTHHPHQEWSQEELQEVMEVHEPAGTPEPKLVPSPVPAPAPGPSNNSSLMTQVVHHVGEVAKHTVRHIVDMMAGSSSSGTPGNSSSLPPSDCGSSFSVRAY